MKAVSILAALALVIPAIAAPAPNAEYKQGHPHHPQHHKKPSMYSTGGQYSIKPTTPAGVQYPTQPIPSCTKGKAQGTTFVPEATYGASPHKKGPKRKATTSPSQGGNGQAPPEETTAVSAPASILGSPASASIVDPANATTTPKKDGTSSLGIPAGCLTKDNIAVGWLPDQDDSVAMSAITSVLGAKACFYGLYSQISGSTYDDSQLTGLMSGIKSSGAVLQAAVMPTGVAFGDITSDLASQIAASMKKFTDEGIYVWLRFGHEMNWYVTDGTYKGGSAAEFVTAWQNVANAVKDNEMVKMYWSPNNVGQDASTLDSWFPGKEYVDVVGIDMYPDDSQVSSFKGTYGAFYDAFSAKYDIPFAVGETAAGGESQQQSWLKSLSGGDASMPNYVGFSWFEYNKEKDWRVVTGPEGDIAKPILM